MTPINDEKDLEFALKNARDRLKAAGLRITRPRMDILTVLYKNTGPQSIELIHKALPQRSCDLVTVYRCLAAFENVGLVRKCFSVNGTCLYEARKDNSEVMYLICKSTGKIEKIKLENARELLKIAQDRGYTRIMLVAEVLGFSAGTEPKLPVE